MPPAGGPTGRGEAEQFASRGRHDHLHSFYSPRAVENMWKARAKPVDKLRAKKKACAAARRACGPRRLCTCLRDPLRLIGCDARVKSTPFPAPPRTTP